MSHTRDVFRRLALLGAALCVLIAGGTIAYSLVEDRHLWHAFVWTVDTVATTGSIQAPQDPAGEVVKVTLTFLGVGTLFYALVSLTELVVTGELERLLAERRARRMTERLRDHYIVCGFGRVGRQVASDLRAAGALYVVVDEDPSNRDAAYAPGVRFINARPSDDEALRDADGSFRPQPATDTLLAAGDVVMAIGTPRTLERLEELFTASAVSPRPSP